MYYGGIDVGGTKTICAVAGDDGKIIERVQFLTDKIAPELFFDGCCKRLEELCKAAGCTFSDLQGIGITLPGMVNENNLLLHAPFLEWHNTDVVGIVQERTGVKNIRCECDVNACGVAEAKRSKYKNFLWVTVSTGIGSAVMIDGKVFRGAHSVSGEVGHNKVEYEHPLTCTCGQLGCAEIQASGAALTRLVLAKCKEDPDYDRLYEEKGLKRDGSGCSALAKEGEERSLALFAKVGDYLGKAIAYAVNILDPECVYIGGGMSRSFDLLYPHIRARLKSDVVSFSSDTPVLATTLGYDASIIGAIALVM